MQSWKKLEVLSGGSSGTDKAVPLCSLPAMAFCRQAKNHPLSSQEFLIRNHKDLNFCIHTGLYLGGPACELGGRWSTDGYTCDRQIWSGIGCTENVGNRNY
ncbi:unnamed protein product [Caretta caretta]